jgi:hypothetical protein
MQFEFYRVRFNLTARDTVRFPRAKPGNVLRGAFGAMFRRIACTPECRDARTCARRSECAYARLFEPAATAGTPSGLADSPRPFVFRAAHLDGQTIAPGAPFHFDVNVFLVSECVIDYFSRAFAELAQEGLGPGRGRAVLRSVDPVRHTVSLDADPDATARVAVQFVTPTELKAGDCIVERPEFGVLMARIRDRLSTLRALYGEGPLELEFAEFGRRASAVRMTACELTHVHASRVSSRTGQRHGLDGFTGRAEYEGELREFVPFLRAARFSGVGRQTTWGKGELEVIEQGERNEQHL